jgi:mannosyl-3-phosphoglycerate phosphatase
MKVIFTDLDGTLLHPQTYSFAPAEPALAAIREGNIPLVLCTSKTRAEVELWRERLGNQHPFIVENGGAVYVPRGCFPFAVPGAVKREGYEVIEFGAPYLDLVLALKEAAKESGTEVLGFHQMSLADVCLRTSLPVKQAELAKRREYDEPFEVLGAGAYALLSAIESRGKRWTRGDRFYHITGDNNKATAVKTLAKLYRRAFGAVETIGVGDGHNDAEFLLTVDVPVIIRSRFAVALKRAVPSAEVTAAPGPHGWNEAILPLVVQQAAAGNQRRATRGSVEALA